MILAALLAAINVPLGKYLLTGVSSLMLASLTYLGGALGAGIFFLVSLLRHRGKAQYLKGKDWIYVLFINILDSCGNAMLFIGLSALSGETASLLQTLEVVSAALFAFFFFREKISWRLSLGILLIVAAAVFLFLPSSQGYEFNPYSLLVVGAALCWGIDDNLTKKIADKDPFEFSFFKCLVPGIILLIVSFGLNQATVAWDFAGYSLLDGFFAYGISVALMTLALRKLSASVGTAVYATNPFLGAILSLIFYPHFPEWNFYVALVILLLGEVMVTLDAFHTEKAAKEKASS